MFRPAGFAYPENMRPSPGERGGAPLWDIAVPARSRRLPGVAMAGFGDLDGTPVGLRLIPHPAVTLALMFGSGSVTVADATGREHRGSVVAGLGPGSVRVQRIKNLQCLQVRLSPLTVRAVLGASPADLNGAVVALEDLWGRAAPRIAEQLADASSWEERFALADALIARRREAGPPVDPEVAWTWNRIAASRGRARVEALAGELGWSRKRLWARFQSQSGLPPKQAAKLVRFDHAAHRLAEGQEAARVAADGGYADQSHLHRDVVALAGVTPAALSAEPFLAIDHIAWPNSHPRTP
jgi:AraC-like DNA-binding protein